MMDPVVRTLIKTDWYRHRILLLSSVGAGLVALSLMWAGGEVLTVLGAVLFFTGIIVLGCMLPGTNVINERKKQTLPFLMSLPVSVTQLTTAKLVSTLGMYLIPWLTLVAAATTFILSRPAIPNGAIPMLLMLSTLTLVGFCVITAVTLITESEGAMIAATIGTNTCYGFGWYLLIRNTAIGKAIASPVPVWSREVLTVLGSEFALIALLLALTFYFQSRKRDFV